MSVIFGIKEEKMIILAGDTRTSSINNITLSDDCQKVMPINEQLCIAIAGNFAIGIAIQMKIDKSNVHNLKVNDIIKIIDNFYKIGSDTNTISNFPFSCLIGGTDYNNKPCLIAINVKNGVVQINDVNVMLYHPCDTNPHDCYDIFAKNLKYNHETFAEQTIKEISSISKVVSPNGHKWVYDFTVGKGKLYSF